MIQQSIHCISLYVLTQLFLFFVIKFKEKVEFNVFVMIRKISFKKYYIALYFILFFCSPVRSNELIPVYAMGTCELVAQTVSEKKKKAKPLTKQTLGYQVIRILPHDDSAFTQGLVFFDGFLYESTGLNGFSSIRQINPDNGQIINSLNLKKQYFAEGLSIYNNKLLQLTWQAGMLLFYSTEQLKLLEKKKLSMEDKNKELWGVTSINNSLLFSNGSAMLSYYDTDTGVKTGQVLVQSGHSPIHGLNELDYAQGKIYSNVWPTDCIAQINPDNGQVEHWLNLQALFPKKQRKNQHSVLNGIAYNKKTDHFFITGKYWPYIFELQLMRIPILSKAP